MDGMFSNETWIRWRELMKTWLEDPGVEVFQGLNLTQLGMDEAYVVAAPEVDVGLYSVSDDCFRCPFELQKSLKAGVESQWAANTATAATWRLYTHAHEKYLTTANITGLVCQLRPSLGEFGVYRLGANATSCSVDTQLEPVDIYKPLQLLTAALAGLWLMCALVRFVVSHIRVTGKLRYGDKELALQQRLRALDTFRGMAIVMMIFVNDGAGGYRWLQHATWNGLAAGDLVFPAFLWIMGVCIPLSARSAFSKGISRWRMLLHIFRRSCIMFALGVSLNTVLGSNELSQLRLPGVLQRLAVCYLLAAGCYCLTAAKYYTPPRGACGQALKDVLSCFWCWVLALLLAVAHTVVTFTVHEPACPPGYLGPGGKHDEWAAAACSGGAAGFVDRALLGADHLYQHGARDVYGGLPFDPEGLLGCMTATVQTLLGVQAGATVLQLRSHSARAARWLAWALALALAGALLAGFSRDHGVVPVNKNLWSISFVCVSSACCLALLSVCYVLTDAWGWWAGGPFRAPGLNAIALYVGHSVCARIFPFHWRLDGMRTHTLFLLEAAWGTALWVVIAHVMAKKKIFISL